MRDYCVRATAYNGKVRAFAVHTTGIVEELRNRHRTWPTATAALGRTVSAALMMGAMLQDEQKLTLQIKGNGPLGQIVVDANAKGEVRGYVDHPDVHLPPNSKGKLDVSGAVGREGYLYVMKDLGLKEPYRGSIPIISGEIAEDITYYFAKSEQTPSAVGLSVLVNRDASVAAAGGFIVQLLPGLEEEEISEIERAISELKPVSDLLLEVSSLEQLLDELLPDVRINEAMDVMFRCQCSRERVERTLISLGKEELSSMLEEDGKGEVICHFCNEAYQFNSEELQDLIAATSK